MLKHLPQFATAWRMHTLLLGAVLFVLAQAACNYTQKITDGPTAYELLRYHEAVPLLKTAYGKEKSRVEQGKLAYMLADSYRQLHQPADAVEWFNISYHNAYGAEALEAYAQMLMQTERYDEAEKAYTELGYEIGSRYQYRRQVAAAELAQTYDASQARFEANEASFDQSGATYGPSYVSDDALLVSADRGGVRDVKGAPSVYAWTGRSYSDLYLQPLPSGTPTPLDANINGDYNEGAAAISPDGNMLAFTRCAPMGLDVGYCQLYLAKRIGDTWSEAQPLSFQEPEVNYTQPAWSPDGMILYFSSDHPDGIGGYDLYTVERMPPQEWSTPVRMSRTINTAADEHFPTIHGDTLLFSSEGHAGFGGLDVYSVYLIGSDTYSTPKNLQPPINSGGDDFAMAYAPATGNTAPHGYFASNRGNGLDRLFRFKMLPPPPPPAVDTQATVDSLLASRLPTWTLDIYVVEGIRRDPANPNSAKLGVTPLESSELNVEAEDQDLALEVVEPGHWRLSLDDSLQYRFLAAADGYLNRDASFSTLRMKRAPGGQSQSFELEIELGKIVTGREVALENIYYDLDKADIRPDAEPTLRELARDLALNPDIRIRLGAHTDCRGNDAYNRDLSQRRAESAVQFLIAQGIDASRLEAQGYGEDVPLTTCACSRCTEDDHQLNRRTTFAIVE